MSLFKSICEGTARGVDLDKRRFWLVIDYARKYFEKDHKLLEVGCDDGAFAVGFSLVGYDVLALDPETTPYLAHLYMFKRMTLDDYARRGGQLGKAFDVVHLGQVLEHVKDPDEMMEQACAACSGRLIVSVPSFHWKGHLRVYTKDQAVEFLGSYMTIEEVHEIEQSNVEGMQTLVMGEPK